MDWTTGIRDAIYFDGELLAYPPDDVKIEEQRAEYSERVADGSLFTQNPVPFTGCENVPRKFSFAFRWPSIAAADHAIFARIRASLSAKDLCVWQPIYEEFTADGTSATFYLARRVAIDTIASPPAGATTRYATVVTLDDVVKTVTTDYTWGSATDLGRKPLTFVSTPTVGQIVRVAYVPLFLVKVSSAEPGFTLPQGMSQSLVLDEVA